MKLVFEHAALSHRGRVRPTNEDSWAVDSQQGIYVVSDGLGGHLAGEVASRIVTETLPPLIRQTLRGVDDLGQAKARRRVRETITALSREIHEQAEGEPGLEGMGATVVLAVVRGEQVLIAHLGDSRAYLFRDGALRPLTKDHSLVQLLIDRGELEPADARTHPARGQVTRSVGMGSEPLPQTKLVRLRAHDRLLLCTDGLVGMLSDAEIRDVLESNTVPQRACERLIDAANAAGGRDNITVVIVHLAESGASDSMQQI